MTTPITKQLNDRINKHKDRQYKEARERAIKSVQGLRVKQTTAISQ